MTGLDASIIEVRGEGRLYEARIRVSYEGKQLEVRINNIARMPHRLAARVEGDYILVHLYSRDGEGIATCCIHKAHLEKGSGAECRSLLLPPGSGG